MERDLSMRLRKYGPEFMQWIHSDSVKAKQMNEMKMLHGKEMRALQNSFMRVAHDMEKSSWSSGWTNHGYEEKIANKDVMALAKDIYAVKEALKAFCESELA